MSYESNDYRALKRNVDRANAILAAVDLARKFQRMKYMGNVTVICDPHQYRPNTETGPLSVVLADGLRNEALSYLVTSAVSRAEEIATVDLENVDLKKACEV